MNSAPCIRVSVCGARYKTRPGLTYHYTHSHKEGTCADAVPPRRGGDKSSSSLPEEETSSSMDASETPGSPGGKSDAAGGGPGWRKFQDTFVTFLNSPGMPPSHPSFSFYLFIFIISRILFLVFYKSFFSPHAKNFKFLRKNISYWGNCVTKILHPYPFFSLLDLSSRDNIMVHMSNEPNAFSTPSFTLP